MKRILKKYKPSRRKFKIELWHVINPPLALAIIKTFTAYKHRRHIYKIWEMLGKYPDASEYYFKNIHGHMLCGKDEIFNTLYFACNDLYKEFRGKIPERIALGDAYSVATSYCKKTFKP